MWNEHSPRIESALADNKVRMSCRSPFLFYFLLFDFSRFYVDDDGFEVGTQGVVQSTAQILSQGKETRRQ